MILKKFSVKNFRGYRNETTLLLDRDLTGIIGKNDAGKSSLLEALDIFFEGGEVTIDKDDFNVDAPDEEIELKCTFVGLPAEIVIDAEHVTSLAAEFLIDNNNELTIKKTYSRSAKKPDVYLVANHPTQEGFGDLHKLKISELKKRAQDLGISAQSVTDARVSASWRHAIWNSASDLSLSLIDLEIGKFSTDSKSIQEKINSCLPMFALFRSDRESRDNDPHARNPLQEAVKQAQVELRAQIEHIQSEIQLRVLDRAARTLEKLSEMDPTLADQLTPRFKKPPQWTFDFTLDGSGDIPINKRGSGVRRLILLNFFRAEAERKVTEQSTPSVIYAVEEPETSQHPSNQEMLIQALLQLSRKNNCQVILTTHVPALASLIPIDGLRFIEKSEDGMPTVNFGSDEVLENICSSLGVLPEFNAKSARALVLVEGPGDVTFFNHLCVALKEAGHIPQTLAEKRIFPVWIGGTGNLKHWQSKRLAEQFGIPWGVLLDSDLGTDEEQKNRDEIEALSREGKKAYLTKKREPENYILPEVVNARLNGNVVAYTDRDDAKKIIGKALKLRDSHVLEKVWPQMTGQQIRQTERYSENGTERFEFSEMINDFLTLVE